MNKTSQVAVLALYLWLSSSLLAISMVYNFRIAQVTGQLIAEEPNKRNHSIIALFFDQYRTKYSGVFQNYIGGLGSYILNHGPWFVRGDVAVSHIKEINEQVTTFSGTETDDILFTVGRGSVLSDRTHMTVSSLFGVPTHKILRLKHADFGYGQIGLGGQWDGSYTRTYNASRGALLYGARYIRFFARDADDLVGCAYRFNIGNVGDLLLAYKQSWSKHGFEGGSTFRWRFGADIHPNLANATEKSDYGRNSFYLVYKYKFKIEDLENRLLFYISYGFDRWPKIFGVKRIVTLWTSWNGRF